MMVSLVPLEGLNQTWLKMIDLVRKFIPHSGGRTTEMAIYKEIATRQAQLWIAFDESDDNRIVAFVVTKVNAYPKGKMLSYEYIGGEDHRLGAWFDEMYEFTKRYAKEIGCVGVESVGRLGWTKLLKKRGWSVAFIIYEQNFDNAAPEIQGMEHG